MATSKARFFACLVAPCLLAGGAVLANQPAFDFTAPHSTGIRALRLRFFPTIHAEPLCSLPACDGTESKPTTWCPDPDFGPCTAYECRTTGSTSKKCEVVFNAPQDACFGCARSTNVKCSKTQ